MFHRSLAAIALLLGAAVVAGCGASPPVQRVEILIHYSHFSPAQVTVPHGVPVTFVLVNEDAIEHEWLIGDAAFHERHRTGTEPIHGERPDEVSVRPMSSAQTTLTFDEPGDVVFICHFPGHEAYGMAGVLHVT